MATYQSIIDKAEYILKDESNDRWAEADHLVAAIEGENEIVKEKPDANAVISVEGTLTAGSQQSLPSGSIQLLDVLCNMGTDGLTRGDVVTVVERKLMNAINPGWMSDTGSATITHVIYDVKRAPKYYWVYPQSLGTNYLEIMTSDLFNNGSKVIGDTVLVDEEHHVALMHYIIARAYSIDSEIPNSAQRAQTHYSMFLAALGKRDSDENRLHPKRTGELD